MRDRTTSYNIILNTIKQEWDKIGSYKISRFHSDYEVAEMNAITNTFGEEVTHGCLFHYVKSLLLWIRKKTTLLWSMYEIKDEPESLIRKFIRQISALPLLPSVEKNRIWNIKLKKFTYLDDAGIPVDNIQKEIMALIKYMETQWLNQRGKRWDFNLLIRTRTTNAAESYYSSLRRDPLTPASHPTIENFFNFLQQITSEIDSRIFKIANGLENPNPQNLIYKEIDERINQALNQYDVAYNLH